MRRIARRGLLVAVVLAAAPSAASATTWCVKDPSCPAGGNGSQSTISDVAGTNRFRSTGAVNGRRLPAGSYRLMAVARNAAGAGKAAFAAFRVHH